MNSQNEPPTEFQAGHITQLLHEARAGGRDSIDRLFSLVYNELKLMSQRQMQRQNAHHTLQPTALVGELYLRIKNSGHIDLQDRSHFFSLAAQVMRQILIDYARQKKAQKRGGGFQRLSIDLQDIPEEKRTLDFLALDEALTELESLDSRKSQIVELRFFSGLSLKEIAKTLKVSPRTIDNDWYMARAWLRERLSTS